MNFVYNGVSQQNHTKGEIMNKTEKLKDQRLQIILTNEEVEKIVALAETNTGENKSLLIRRLINMAFAKPQAFELHPPKKH